jgi:hypothetical protein
MRLVGVGSIPGTGRLFVATVRRCRLKPVESRVDSAWSQRLKFAGFNICFPFQLVPLDNGADQGGQPAEAHHERRGPKLPVGCFFYNVHRAPRRFTW